MAPASSLLRRAGAEAVGSCFLLATIIGSGIMGEQLASGNLALALLANTLATAAMLIVLITLFGPLSGAHFNPAISCVFAARRVLPLADTLIYCAAQFAGAILGVWLTHAMFDQSILQISLKERAGLGQWLAETVATTGLVIAVLGAQQHRPAWTPIIVGLYITAAYWFTASTSFANPAVTVARSLTASFSGIRPEDVLAFIIAQTIGVFFGLALTNILLSPSKAPKDQ